MAVSRKPDAPLTFRQFIARVAPKFQFYPHLDKLIEVLQQVADGLISRLMVFMPPRHGKSETVSRLFSAYYLYRHPDRWVAITSYAAELAFTLSRNARENYSEGGGPMSADAFAVKHWETGLGGGLWATGVGGPATGKGFHLGICDDPLKNSEEAASETVREKHKDWWRSTFSTREEPNGAIVVIMCMTGDTPVLMADGTERLLRDIKVGDQVATYDNGKLATSTVRNHRSNGLDSIFRIKTTCGKIVHANERHPFLVEEHGQLKWIRLKNLTTTHKIVTVRGSGANGRGRLALLKDVTTPSVRGDIALHTTAKRCGPMGIAPHRSMQSTGAIYASSSGMESLPQSMTPCTKRKAASVPFAVSRQGITCERIGAASCALIAVTKLTRSGGYCATTATLPWDTPRQKQPHALWSNTSDFTTAQIESIEPAGVEEVFDIQIERTENFIANGLVSHNTRWHEDDLAGWLLSKEAGAEDEPEGWHVVNMPAIAEDEQRQFPPSCTVYPDLRGLGEALCPERYSADKLHKVQRRLGTYFWASLYQQRPAPAAGEIFKRQHWRYWQPRNMALPPVMVRSGDGEVVAIAPVELPEQFDQVVQSWDLTFKDTRAADPVAGLVAGRVGANKYLLDRRNGRMDIVATLRAIAAMSIKWPQASAKLVEDKANGPAVIRMLHSKIAGLIAVEPQGGKLSRAQAAQPEVESGNVYLPHPHIAAWVDEFINNCAAFPNAAHDDDVDAFTQLIAYWQMQGGIAVEELAALFDYLG